MKVSTGCALLGLVVACAAQASPVTVQHKLGKTTVAQVPKRVVVIGFGALDAVTSFGIEPVAVSKTQFMPAYLSQYAGDQYRDAGSLFEPDFEAIYNAKPDVIIIGPRAEKAYDELTKIAPTFVFGSRYNTDYWQHTQEEWHKLGKIFDIEPKVDAAIAKLDKQFQAVHDYNQQHSSNALVVMASGGNISTFGTSSRFSSVFHEFGFKTAAQVDNKGQHGDLISYEYIRQHNPDNLFIIDRDKLVNPKDSHTHENFENKLVQATKAYQDGHMYYLDLNAWYLGISGVHATEQMIQDVQQATQ
ncbi:siderophore ABC transporter substrate-binding protein [Vibrio zhugei]|uniref:Siderophore ABC transporter substrate-binding protein n=1 Tax=Vibrio zhugei TaxID=2479546 RepID=A0ABV7CAZ4_9VIBR|nr:siderophore ABC transporter substrate-binding protein [Vibrio zhugei]